MNERYRDLFVHRSDVYAVQSSEGSYFPAGSGHWATEGHDRQWVYDEYWPLTDVEIEEHLAGFASYGTYVIRPDGFTPIGNGPNSYAGVVPPQSVRYVCVDLDTYDNDALAFLCGALERLVAQASPSSDPVEGVARGGFRCLLLEDSGGKGYHLWLFLSAPLPAAQVRYWTEPIRAQYQAMSRTASEPWPALEIFPKQDEVPEGGFGNLVKLPLGRHAVSGATSRWVRRPGWAGSEMDVEPFPSALVPAMPPAEVRERGEDDGLKVAPFACISEILQRGAGKGIRDNALYHFARYAVATGAPSDLVAAWTERVNEGFDPPLSPTEVRTKVRSALAANTANPGCSAEWLRDYCPGGASCFAPWNDRKSNDPGDIGAYEDAWLSPEARRAQRTGNT